MGGRFPGPLCQVRNWYDLNDGTMVRQMSPLPGSLDFVSKPLQATNNTEPLELTGEMLLRIVPPVGTQADIVASSLNQALKEAGITTRIGQAMFIAQLAHESAGFTRLNEMGGKVKYTFAKYQEKEADDKEYDYFFFMYDKDSPSPRRQKVALRLGNDKAGDGALYKGRGYIQLTGRANYRAAGKTLDLELERNPGEAATPSIAARIAGWYWRTRKLNSYANVDSEDNFKQVTLRINGGYRGLEERKKYYNQAKFVLLAGGE
ncbi:MAG TPA: glycoside hydrolase family 19 protein [Blastocatellia bacterium]|nr:glycoside hydrolase family 19 protein [Blastocatellia bacterium]